MELSANGSLMSSWGECGQLNGKEEASNFPLAGWNRLKQGRGSAGLLSGSYPLVG